jgi:hypothetical protein
MLTGKIALLQCDNKRLLVYASKRVLIRIAVALP